MSSLIFIDFKNEIPWCFNCQVLLTICSKKNPAEYILRDFSLIGFQLEVNRQCNLSARVVISN